MNLPFFKTVSQPIEPLLKCQIYSRNMQFSHKHWDWWYHRFFLPLIFSGKLEIVRHEAAQKMRVWPLGVGLQEQASKHLKLLWSKAMVVSVEEKVPPDGISCESERRAQANHPMRCRKLKDDVKTGGYLYTRISPGDTCLLPGRRPA